MSDELILRLLIRVFERLDEFAPSNSLRDDGDRQLIAEAKERVWGGRVMLAKSKDLA